MTAGSAPRSTKSSGDKSELEALRDRVVALEERLAALEGGRAPAAELSDDASKLRTDVDDGIGAINAYRQDWIDMELTPAAERLRAYLESEKAELAAHESESDDRPEPLTGKDVLRKRVWLFAQAENLRQAMEGVPLGRRSNNYGKAYEAVQSRLVRPMSGGGAS